MSPLKFLRRHWHDIGFGSAVVAGICLLVGWPDVGTLQRLLIGNFMVVLLHQFEEYSWPGGFPAVANVVLFNSQTPDRWPLNQNSSMAANVTFAYIFYLVPVFFPHVIWLGLAPVLAGATMQFFGHVIYVNWRLRSFYSPGVVTTVFGHLPIAAIYLHYIYVHHLANGREWLLGVGYMIAALLSIFGALEVGLLGNRNSRYPFDPDEMERFDIQGKLARARS